MSIGIYSYQISKGTLDWLSLKTLPFTATSLSLYHLTHHSVPRDMKLRERLLTGFAVIMRKKPGIEWSFLGYILAPGPSIATHYLYRVIRFAAFDFCV